MTCSDIVNVQTDLFSGESRGTRCGAALLSRETVNLANRTRPKLQERSMSLFVGSDKGKFLVGINAIERDILKICEARPGDERPTEFKAGKRVICMTFKREKQ